MKKDFLKILAFVLITISFSCSEKSILFKKDSLRLVNREIVSIDNSGSTISLNNKRGSGMAVIKDLKFEEGIIELELKGENKPQRSFVGVAFNIQNDSVYEALYFRPFNFQSKEKNRREHSIQYICKPDFEWRFLRKNYNGKYEAEFIRKPNPDDWFGVKIIIENKKVYVYDQETNTELLSVDRLTKQVSDKIGLWTGFDSKGTFRNLIVTKK